MPRTRLDFPDSNRKDNKSAARGDVPVLFINSNLVKDSLNGRLDVVVPGKGMYHMPDWLPDEFYQEMCVEVLEPGKGWINPNQARNEAWDLSYYALALCISPKMLAVESLDWDNAPGWAKPHDENDLVREAEQATRFVPKPKTSFSFSSIAEELA